MSLLPLFTQMSFDEEMAAGWSIKIPDEPRDNYESSLINDGLAIPSIYFDKNGKFPQSS